MKSQVFVPTVSALGLLVIGHCVSTLIQQPLDPDWIALAVLTLFSGSLTIRIPSVGARLSVSETFVFASVLLFGASAGGITVALEILVSFAVLGRTQRTNPQKIIFSVAAAALSIWLAGSAFYYFAGIEPLSKQPAQLQTLLIPLAILSTLYFVLNSGSIALAMAIEKGTSALSIWRGNFLGLAINYFAGASLAALFVTYTRTIDLFAISVIVPLLLVSYLTFKTSLGRVEDATKHVEQMKRLYLSTIETMATAIDAKDQVTHGHIRRVQQFALALARDVGVNDESQLQALEAASLLHDTGKLVIPEHILNKPGKLTRGEFERMKSHARVGAEILSSIDFPFPVVPIVRHHHENWDGSGYPDGLKGTDIPIGARILAVVDCFDALTSDRPYRPKMETADALRILMQRRGTMYDPLVVDTFVSSWQRYASAIDVEPNADTARANVVIDVPPVANRRSLERKTPTTNLVDDTLDVVLARTGADLAILFATDRENDRITSVAVGTPEGRLLSSISMPLGSGVSGWVAVNSATITNADPTLDLRQFAVTSALVRIICVPIRQKGETVGVLSVYSRDARGFSDDDRACLEETVHQLESQSGVDSFETYVQRHKSLSQTAPATIH